ncbi:uncharacterized protein [Amphiura filiformis]|uniref:uncharacterized protein n=1 Tax=Amphiura filiformis TaxID=82378 RepID=UPI003B21DF37
MSITPFLSVYYKQLGLSPFRIGLATFVSYVGVTLFTPVIGVLADRYRSHKIIKVFLGTVWILSGIIIGFAISPKQIGSCEQILITNQQSIRCDASIGHSRTDISFGIFELFGNNTYYCGVNITQNTSYASNRGWMYEQESMDTTFYLIVTFTSLLITTFHPMLSIADAEAINALEDTGKDIADYGQQRAFGSLGWGFA